MARLSCYLFCRLRKEGRICKIFIFELLVLAETSLKGASFELGYVTVLLKIDLLQAFKRCNVVFHKKKTNGHYKTYEKRTNILKEVKNKKTHIRPSFLRFIWLFVLFTYIFVLFELTFFLFPEQLTFCIFVLLR